jgi:hypothetical protein
MPDSIHSSGFGSAEFLQRTDPSSCLFLIRNSCSAANRTGDHDSLPLTVDLWTEDELSIEQDHACTAKISIAGMASGTA